jgi:hypothetical protein
MRSDAVPYNQVANRVQYLPESFKQGSAWATLRCGVVTKPDTAPLAACLCVIDSTQITHWMIRSSGAGRHQIV